METFFPFFIVLLTGLFLSTVFSRFNIPWVITLILAGILIGPFGIDLVHVTPTIEFISETGLVLLMFMAGLETKLSSFKKFRSKMIILAFINGAIPFLFGFLIPKYLGFSDTTSLLIGIIFVSSSIAVVVPSLEANDLINTNLGSSVLATSIIQDIASLVLLSLFLQSERNLANLPLIVFYPLVILVLVAVRYLLPKFQEYLLKVKDLKFNSFQRDIRAVLAVLFGTVIIFELLGLHPIIAGFFGGLVLSESLKSKILMGKIRAISYGIFIPTFFVIVGTKTNLDLLFAANDYFVLTLAIVVGSLFSKFASGTIGAGLVGFTNTQSMFFGATSIPQLSTTLAATFTASKLGILSTDLVTTLVVLSIVSTIIGPLLMSLFVSHLLTNKDIEKPAGQT